MSIDWPARPWGAQILKQAFAKKIDTYKGKDPMPSEAQLDYCRSGLSKLDLSDVDRHTITLYLFDKESTGQLTAAECSAIIDWIGAKAPDYEVSQDARVEARAVIKQYQIEAGQTQMVPK